MKVELTGFPDKLDIQGLREREESKMTPVFWAEQTEEWSY